MMKNVWRKQYPDAPLYEPSSEWFVNRKENLNWLWEWAISIPTKGSHSITGLRRTGKSTMMAKLYNRLYFEQEKVMPVYITFADYLHKKEPITAQQFAEEFVASAVRSYLAFTRKRPELQDSKLRYSVLKRLVEEHPDKVTSEWFRTHQFILEESFVPSHEVVQWSINFLAGHARWEEQPMLIMIDEFQVLTQVLYPEDGRVMDITDSFQHASESWDAPLLVSGSSISMLQGEALGGLLSGRFSPFHVGPLEEEHGVEMVKHLGEAKKIPITDKFAETIMNTTQGYPYSIECIMQSKSPACRNFPDPEAVEAVVDFELTHHQGALGKHYHEEYGKYVNQLNGDNITRRILYWITDQEADDFAMTARAVANTLNLDIMEVHDSLEKLRKMDIIYQQFPMIYHGPRDPLMRLYLNAFHSLDLDDVAATVTDHEASAKFLRRKLNKRQGEINRQIGHLTEIIVAGAVRAFDERLVDGETYFGVPGDVKLSRCDKIRRREGIIAEDTIHEIDVVGEYRYYGHKEHLDFDDNRRYGVWLVSVRYRKKRMGVADVRKFIRDVEAVQDKKGYGEVVRWYFSKSGFTKDAKALLQAEGVYHSDLEQFNLLTEMFDLMALSA